jgi:hypothetical protein
VRLGHVGNIAHRGFGFEPRLSHSPSPRPLSVVLTD